MMKLKQLQTTLAGWLESLLALVILAMLLIVVTLVVMRYAFNSSITGANEWVTILFVYASSLGAAVCLSRGEHIAIGVGVDWLSKPWRVRLERLTLLLVAILNVCLILFSVGWIRVTGSYLMPATGLPRIVAQFSVPLGCGLAALFCLLRAIHCEDDVAGHLQESDS